MGVVVGKHYIVDYLGCDTRLLTRAGPVEELLLRAVEICGATYLSHHVRQFEPAGVTAVVLIGESHFSLHTWPEHDYAGLDIFTCGETMQAEVAIDFLARELRAGETRTRTLHRGT